MPNGRMILCSIPACTRFAECLNLILIGYMFFNTDEYNHVGMYRNHVHALF